MDQNRATQIELSPYQVPLLAHCINTQSLGPKSMLPYCYTIRLLSGLVYFASLLYHTAKQLSLQNKEQHFIFQKTSLVEE